MVKTAAIERLTLIDLMEHFGLREATDKRFFAEWQTALPELSEYEQNRIDHITAIYQNFKTRDSIESTVGLTILSPLLDSVGLFVSPFYVETEKSVDVAVEDKSLIVRGRLDILVIKKTFWVLTIEAKRAGLSLTTGIPQVITYMLAAPTPQSTLYGMVTNGRNFIFIKLDRTVRNVPVYKESDEFIIDQNDGLEKVARITKKIASVIAAP